ncbi:MAG: protoporphyrinogen oxidase [Terriglobia bacterium]
MHRVVIIGGGISGLSAAHFLEKSAAQAGVEIQIDLLEAQDRLGGVIRTERVGDCLLEGGPDSFLSLKPAALDLCRELGLADQLVPSNDDRRKTYVLRDGKLCELPEGLMFVVPSRVWPLFRSDLFSLGGKLRLAVSPLLSPHGRNDSTSSSRRERDVSAAEFIRSRFGSEVLERLAEPLLAAVYGADPDAFSAQAALPQLVALEEKYGSLWRGVRAAAAAARSHSEGSLFITLRDGVGELIGKLQAKLQRTRVRAETAVTSVRRAPGGRMFCVESSKGQAEADAVIVATPAFAAGRLLRQVDGSLVEQLGAIQYHSSVIVAFGFERSALRSEPDGFGFVVPRGERKRLAACTWVSTKFPFRSPPERFLARCFLGGARDPAILEEADDRLVEIALGELGAILGERPKPLFHRIYRWERCMPQYAVGHLGRLEEIAARLAGQPGLFLAGNGYKGVGIPDCIQSASAAAAGALRYLESLGPRS